MYGRHGEERHACGHRDQVRRNRVEALLRCGAAPFASFLKLASIGFYNGTTFHRVNPPGLKVIQGGDPNSKTTNRATHGLGGPGFAIPAEFNSRPHRRGTLSMARGNDPNSAGSQFFICADDCGSLDWQYTVFGEVTRGLETVDAILNVKKDGNDNPLERIEMTVTVKENP